MIFSDDHIIITNSRCFGNEKSIRKFEKSINVFEKSISIFEKSINRVFAIAFCNPMRYNKEVDHHRRKEAQL